MYENDSIDKKREVISSIFPEKMHFENNCLRTGRVNEVVDYIYLLNKQLDTKKRGQKETNFNLSSEVGMAGFEPTTSCSQSRRDTGLRYTPNMVDFAAANIVILFTYRNNLSFFLLFLSTLLIHNTFIFLIINS